MDLAFIWKYWIPKAHLFDQHSMPCEFPEELWIETFLHIATFSLTRPHGAHESILHSSAYVSWQPLDAYHISEPC